MVQITLADVQKDVTVKKNVRDMKVSGGAINEMVPEAPIVRRGG